MINTDQPVRHSGKQSLSRHVPERSSSTPGVTASAPLSQCFFDIPHLKEQLSGRLELGYTLLIIRSNPSQLGTTTFLVRNILFFTWFSDAQNIIFPDLDASDFRVILAII
jgi:hypothetical protein